MTVRSPHGRQTAPGPLDAAAAGPAGRSRLTLLDCFQLEHAGRHVPTPNSAGRLIAFLGVRGRSSRTEVAGTLWPDVPEPRAHASLRTVLWRLHRLAAAAPVVAGRDALSLSPDLEVDVQTLEASARKVLGACGGVDPGAVEGWVFVGELLPGWYDDWVLFERERLRQLQLHTLEAAADRLTAAGRHAEAIEAALAAIRLEPLRESAARALIVAYLAEHNVVEAVRRFEYFRHGLATELGVSPTPALERLVRNGYCATQ